ncbi:MAG: hypothetical protein M0Z99_07310 [Betaproteobacteria bacterium]|nr:hypothetical protein [Betaproteobacteria bacterium]
MAYPASLAEGADLKQKLTGLFIAHQSESISVAEQENGLKYMRIGRVKLGDLSFRQRRYRWPDVPS